MSVDRPDWMEWEPSILEQDLARQDEGCDLHVLPSETCPACGSSEVPSLGLVQVPGRV